MSNSFLDEKVVLFYRNKNSEKDGIRYVKTYLNKEVSLREALFATAPDVVENIKTMRSKLEAHAQDFDKQEFKKKHIPCFPSSVLTDAQSHAKSHIISYNGYICIDIDDMSPDEARPVVNAMPYTLLSAVSCSGKGLFCIFAIPKPQNEDEFKAYFHAIEKYFAGKGIKIDSGCCNANRLRYQTIDPNPYINENAIMWTVKLTTPKKEKKTKAKKHKESAADGESEQPNEPKEYDTAICAEFAQSGNWKSFVEAKGLPRYHRRTPYNKVPNDERYKTKPDNAKKLIRQVRPASDGKARLVKIKKGRRNSQLYKDAILLKGINPSLTFEVYFICCINEFIHCYDNTTEPMHADEIIHVLTEAWESECTISKEIYMPSFEIDNIYAIREAKKKGVSTRQIKRSLVPRIAAERRHADILKYYDPNKTIAENVEAISSPTYFLKSYGFAGKKITRNTLIAALKRAHIKTYEERKEEAIVNEYIWGASCAKDLQIVGDGKYTLDRKTARKRFNELEDGRTKDVSSAAFFYWMMNLINKKRTWGILSRLTLNNRGCMTLYVYLNSDIFPQPHHLTTCPPHREKQKKET